MSFLILFRATNSLIWLDYELETKVLALFYLSIVIHFKDIIAMNKVQKRFIQQDYLRNQLADHSLMKNMYSWNHIAIFTYQNSRRLKKM